ncbi:Pyridine nucleotide-disulfide oxidoreductase [Candidatus Methanoperedens nitroreducens]|uniref:CoB--CoM heterodisulfide reductase iron-sulfur subunit A n=1 Tax=Candidatus Methanoperedens nitratireducens TaxID=1392998 RepID=A0A062V4D2_9EURY|nr:FAD-dependent oxidoreductase [Candidatus Methanoperedens nitroreducens]KCZ71428.1 Pyridine nucleotide-disulfide oxidoreductase [Candidatus Methanoperedens nitroreducens]MDJ1421054.1 FAD-dependent oxidoreductase [Candidatus Methanoperedens sp.]
MKGSVAVVGGGIAGIQAALDLADSGFKTYLIESRPSIGGVMSQLDKTFPTNDCAMCILSPKLVEIGRHPNIELLSYSDVKSISGEAGDFKVKVVKKARYVDEAKCTGCGSCTEKCPSKVLDEYNAGMSKRKSIYIPFAQAIPRVATIDAAHCLYLTKGKCGVCKKVCGPKAVDYEMKDKEIELDVGSVILATGFKPFDPSLLKQYRFDHPDVITSLQFERLLSASGPTQGHVTRQSDGKVPKRIAFIQCVGSRNPRIDRKHCSSVCCMYATKESIIAKEHDPELDITIFHIDIRAFGKNFEEFYNRAQEEYGIRYINSRPPETIVDARNNLSLRYEDFDSGELKTEAFDMVILSIGLDPSDSTRDLAQSSGIALDDFGNIATGIEKPVETSISGVYVCGAAQGPKDIPDTVAQASAAAAKAAALLSKERGTMIKEREFPDEKPLLPEPRIGVFVCHCGINIGSVVNVPDVVEYAKTLPDVAYAREMLYACSSDSQVTIKDAIEKNNLNRVVVASCTPRTHEPLFQNTCREAGLNPYLFELANIREHCSWVHMKEKEKATEKAKGIVQMAVAKSALFQPLYKQKVPLINKALVLGGGVAGMTAALDIADNGYEVTLIEKEKELGGMLKHTTELYDGKKPSDVLDVLTCRVYENNRIRVLNEARLTKVEGYLGNFKGIILSKGEEVPVDFGAAVVATGARNFEPVGLFNYGKDAHVITQAQLERMLGEGISANNTTMIQCVGARNKDREYCGRTCCIDAVKNAVRIKRANSKSSVYVLYRDMRTYGVMERLYEDARELGVIFIKYTRDPEVQYGSVVVHDSMLNEDIEIASDLVVLSTPLVAGENEVINQLFKIPLDKNGFFLEAHPKLRPVDFATDGVFLCGSAQAPKLMSEAISQASAAASRACTILSREFIETEGAVSVVDEARCIGCGTCVAVCPYNAPSLQEVTVTSEEVSYIAKKSRINPAACKGCGSCAAACPVGAITAQHFSSKEIGEAIDAFNKDIGLIEPKTGTVEAVV